ncbi:uncharacterized protein TNCV_583862 [Trichonephila clavipes]|nr:uncharacterized protein TNCV_583862 [Trichonephila clavipes]
MCNYGPLARLTYLLAPVGENSLCRLLRTNCCNLFVNSSKSVAIPYGWDPFRLLKIVKFTVHLVILVNIWSVELELWNLCSIVRIYSSMSKEAVKALNRKRGAVKAQLTRIKDFMNNPYEKDKTHLESKLDTLKSLRIKLSDIRDEYYEVVADDSDLESLESEILDLEDDCEDIQRMFPTEADHSFENGGEFVGHSKDHSTMLLSTALVYSQNSRGEVFPLRALLDSGSQSNLITHEAALTLGLKCEGVNTTICCVNGTFQFIKNKVSTVSSKNRKFQKLMEFLVVLKITGLTPTNKLDISGIKIPEYIKLSDENFYSPGRIDLLLSNQIFYEILNNGKIKLADGKLILQDTVFGYVASGDMSHNYTNKSYCGLVTNANELNNSIKRFWKIENCPDFEILSMSREEKKIMDPSCLGDSKQMALRRLNSLWRRLVQDPRILELYRNFIHEYLEMGHMESSGR